MALSDEELSSFGKLPGSGLTWAIREINRKGNKTDKRRGEMDIQGTIRGVKGVRRIYPRGEVDLAPAMPSPKPFHHSK